MTISNILVGLLLIVSIFGSSQSRPNIIFIVSDDLNDNIHGLGGHPQALTPNLDKLASVGVRFTNAVSNCPICNPSRSSFITGIYPHTSGLYANKQQSIERNALLSRSKTFIEHFRDNGYLVFGTGKIFHSVENEKLYDKFGAQIDHGPYPSTGQKGKRIIMIPHPSIIKPYGKTAYESFAPLSDVPVVKPDSVEVLVECNGWMDGDGQEFKYENEKNRDLMPDEKSVEFAKNILNKKHNLPFALFIGFVRPHQPFYAPKSFFNLYPIDQVQISPGYAENDIDDCANILTQKQREKKGPLGSKTSRLYEAYGKYEGMRKVTQAYLACVSFVDYQVGEIMKVLENSPYRDNTIIIFTSDHGIHLCEKEWLYKETLWSKSLRIPFLIKGPGIKSGISNNQPISLIDLYPTFVDACNLNKGKENLRIEGHSIMPLVLKHSSQNWNGSEVALSTILGGGKLNSGTGGYPKGIQHYAVRSRKYSYILCNNGEEELYDHSIDPFELNNLVQNKAYKTIKNKLQNEMNKLLE